MDNSVSLSNNSSTNSTMTNIAQSIKSLQPEAQFAVIDEDINQIDWLSQNIPQPTKEEIQTKLQELRAAEPLRLLRLERNRLLQETDWRFRSDLTPSQEWIDYCQALRDLPSTASPELDENGQLINVTWPTKPE